MDLTKAISELGVTSVHLNLNFQPSFLAGYPCLVPANRVPTLLLPTTAPALDFFLPISVQLKGPVSEAYRV